MTLIPLWPPTGSESSKLPVTWSLLEVIQDRIHAGLARARAQGKRLGRPSIPVTIERKIRDALKKGGTGIRKLAAKHHVGVGTVQRGRAHQALIR